MIGAIGLVLSFVGAMVAQYAWENWKCRRCDACRIERAQSGRSTVILTHACSPRRWPYRARRRAISQGEAKSTA